MKDLNKNNTVFFMDSNEELSFDIAESLNCQVISMPYVLNGEIHDYWLGKGFDGHQFFETIRKGAMPTTTALNPQDYVNYFEPIFAQGKDILYVHFSHKMSGTFSYMETALYELKEKYPDRKLIQIDSLSISMGAGLLVQDLAQMFANGESVASIVDYAEKNRHHYIAYFTVSDLNHLKRGGRLSAVSAFVGGILGIKPIIMITKEGELKKLTAVSGRKKSMQELLNLYLNGSIEGDTHPVYILHADCLQEAEELKQMLLKVRPLADVKIQMVGPTIGTHCGPDTLAISFFGNNSDL